MRPGAPPPRLAQWLVSVTVPDDVRDAALGDLDELFLRDCASRGAAASLAYWRRAFAFAWHFTFEEWREARRGEAMRVRMSAMDVKLGLRMLAKYPGLSVAGGLALAIAIGIGAAWFDLSRDLLRPRIPLPHAKGLVEVEMRDLATGQDERRLMHDFVTWRREVRSLEDLGAYRTLERNLFVGGARTEPVTVAETTATAFHLGGVQPVLGRPLVEADERRGAAPVAVIGHTVWQRFFGGSADVVGRVVQFGRARAEIVGVMPEGFAFPVNHRAWMPLQVDPAGYSPLNGPAIRVFGRVAPGATQAQANAELMAIAERQAGASSATHEHLRPRVLAYGGESPGDRSVLELALTHLPIVLVLIVACANVGTLMYARTATREAEIAMRHALGATRARIVGQLFVEALVLASLAAAAGLALAEAALKVGVTAYYSGVPGGPPFWVAPGLNLKTMLYAAGLTVTGAALLGVLPALKATRTSTHGQIRTLGQGSTLRFGAVWTTVMIAQVALAVICMPPAAGMAGEALRDRRIRAAFPAEHYLAVRIDLDREQSDGRDESDTRFAARFARVYADFERRLRQVPGVQDVTFGDRLPGMVPTVRPAEFEAAPGSAPTPIGNLWMASVGPRYFEAFDRPIVAGRGFHDADRTDKPRTVVVNEAFARQYLNGSSPVGFRLRHAGHGNGVTEPWLEIVGVVRDIGMTPTDRGEAPYAFEPASLATTQPIVMGIRVWGDSAAAATRVRSIAATLDPGLRLDDVRSLDELVWKTDLPMVVAAGTLAGVVGLGVFLSAAGIFALMSVSVARRTREIGLRAALGANNMRLLAGVFSRAAVLVGGGVLAGNAVLLFFVALQPDLRVGDLLGPLVTTSAVMLAVGLIACVEPARRALRIDPIDALKQS